MPSRYIGGHFHRADGTTQQEAGHAWAEAFVPGLGNVPGLKELAFQASNGEALPRAFLFEGSAYAFVVKERTPAQREDFEQVKDARLAALRRSREQAAVADFVSQLRQQTEVVYNQALLAQLMPQQPASASP